MDNTKHTCLQNVCGVLVLQWFGLPIPCNKDGPFSIADLNQRILPFNVRLAHCSSKTIGVDGEYLCHHRNHFTGLHSSEGYFQHFDNGKVQVWNVGDVGRLADSSEVKVFQLKAICYTQEESQCLAEVVGGSNGKYECPLTECIHDGCCGTLLQKMLWMQLCMDLRAPRR